MSGRWAALFDDFEGQLQAEQVRELVAEVTDRTRREAATVRLGDRLRASVGLPLSVGVIGAGHSQGDLIGLGPDWLLLRQGATEVLVPLGAVEQVTGLAGGVWPEPGAVAGRLDLRHCLRALARDRSGVCLILRSGTQCAGTLDRVAADHVDLAEHPPGEPRRQGAVRSSRTVALAAIAVIRRS